MRSTTSGWSPRPRSTGTVASRRAAWAAPRPVELDMGTEGFGEAAPLPVGLEPDDALGDRPADRVRAAFVSKSLLDQGVGRPVAAIALVRAGHRDDDDSGGRGGRDAPESRRDPAAARAGRHTPCPRAARAPRAVAEGSARSIWRTQARHLATCAPRRIIAAPDPPSHGQFHPTAGRVDDLDWVGPGVEMTTLDGRGDDRRTTLERARPGGFAGQPLLARVRRERRDPVGRGPAAHRHADRDRPPADAGASSWSSPAGCS